MGVALLLIVAAGLLGPAIYSAALDSMAANGGKFSWKTALILLLHVALLPGIVVEYLYLFLFWAMGNAFLYFSVPLLSVAIVWGLVLLRRRFAPCGWRRMIGSLAIVHISPAAAVACCYLLAWLLGIEIVHI